jgi:ankyrin repeat protein
MYQLSKNRDVEGGDYYFDVARDNELLKLKRFVQAGVSLSLCDDFGDTLLTSSSKKGYIESVDFLIKNGADINYQNEDGKTALVVSIENGFPDIAKMLLSSGANPSFPTTKKRFNAGHFLMRSLYGSSKLKFNDKVESLLEMMFANGLPINQVDVDGQSLLSLAIDMPIPLNISIFLIKNGADISQRSNIGYAPIHYAALRDRHEHIDLLMNNGADINVLSKAGKTPIFFAYKNETFISILRHKPLLDILDNSGDTPLTFHVDNNSLGDDFLGNIIRLVESGASIDFPNAAGETPQKIAEKKNYHNVSQFFSSAKVRLVVESLLANKSIPRQNNRANIY